MATGTLTMPDILSTEWHITNQVIHFRLWDSLSNANKVDIFCQWVSEIIEEWSPNQPWLAIFDHSQVQQPAWTPYLQQNLEKTLLQIPKQTTGRSATVMNYTSRTYVVKAYLEYRFQRQQPQIEHRLFLALPSAIRWIEAGL